MLCVLKLEQQNATRDPPDPGQTFFESPAVAARKWRCPLLLPPSQSACVGRGGWLPFASAFSASSCMILASALWSEAESATKRLAHGVERRTKIREDNMGVEKSGLSKYLIRSV